LLNVRAEGMSAWAAEADHFAKAFEQAGGDRRGFAQRRFFARYLRNILNEAVGGGLTRLIEATAVSGIRDGEDWRIGFEDGSSIEARALVLATGNQEPEGLRAFSQAASRFIGNPWGSEARSAVAELASDGDNALLVGTGLTMVDLVLSLDSAGFQGRIVALSRRGLAPRAHADFDPAPVDEGELPKGSVRALLRWLRRRGAEVGWRAAIDSLRPHSQALWQSLGLDEQRRFIRHARPWWDVHRHRIAPEVAGTIARLIAEGRLEIIAGRVVSAREMPDGLDVEMRRRRSGNLETRRFCYAFNCTGPLHSIEGSKDPLLRSLLDGGQVRPDHLGIGLDVDGESRAGERLWALGPLTKGRYWEIIAVPDIRDQAAAVAQDIARELQ
jgi:uncharacterized NAD(P)/FAD-binding protein YdhS